MLTLAFLPIALLATTDPSAETGGLAELRRLLPSVGAGTLSVHVTDLNGDEHPDLVVVETDGVATFAGDRLGTFGTRLGFTEYGPEVQFPRRSGLGDFDGDADLDLWIGGIESDAVYRNIGDGAYVLVPGGVPPSEAKSAPTTRALAFLDADGDGDVDTASFGTAVTENPAISEEHHRLFVNGGTGSFELVDAIPKVGKIVHSAAAADVDSDGVVDLVLGVSGQNLVLVGDARAGYHVRQGAFPELGSTTVAIALGDLDQDGHLDLFAGNRTTGPAANRVYLNDGTGTFSSVEVIETPAPTFGVALSDLDGDGDLDAFAANTRLQDSFSELSHPTVGGGLNSWQDQVLLNDGSGSLEEAAWFADINPGLSTSVVTADVDSDGDEDVIVGGVARDRILLNSRNAGLVDTTQATTLFGVLRLEPAMVSFDANSDGFPDLVISPQTPPLQLYSNSGSGTFEYIPGAFPLPIPFSGPGPFRVCLDAGDLNGDGVTDLLLGKRGGQDEVLVGDGHGNFTALPPTIDVDDTSALALGDFRGVGILDALYGENGLGNGCQLLRNNGQGAFDSSGDLIAPINTRAFALGDLDGDSDLDAMATAFFGLSTFVNDGQGNLSESAATFPSAIGFGRDVELADFDGDGDLDAYVANNGSDRALFNDGTGNFGERFGVLPHDEGNTSWVEAGDLDGNGAVDLLLGGNYGPVPEFRSDTRILLGDGAGNFAAAPDEYIETSLPGDDALLTDVDLDGDLDAVLVGVSQLQIYSNLQRQLARLNTPRIGKPLAFGLHGPAHAPWGLRLIDPPLAREQRFVATGELDGHGRARVTFDVPPAPSLVGTALTWQALVGREGTPTNLERMTLTDL